MTLSTTPVVGIPTETHWPQVFKHHGANFSFVSSFCIKDSKEVRDLGKQFLEEVERLPLSSKIELSSAISTLVLKYGDKLVSFAAGYFSDGHVLLWSSGNGKILLRRGEKSGKVLQSEALKVVEGSALGNDTFFFTTEGFSTICTDPFDHESLTDEELAALCIPKVHTHPKGSLAAAYVVQVHEGEMRIESGGSVVLEEKNATTPTANSAKYETVISNETLPQMLRLKLLVLGGFIWSKLPIARKDALAHLSKKTKIVMLLVVLLVILAISLIIGWTKHQATLREQKVMQIIQPFQQQLDEAKAKQNIDLTAARELASSSLQGAKNKLPQLPPKSYEYSRLNAFIATAQTYYNGISGEKTLDKLNVFYDLQLVKSDFLARSMAISENSTLVFLDAEKNSAVSLAIDKKQPSVPDMSGVTGAKDIAITEKNIYVLGDGVFEAGKTVIKKSDTWNDPLFLRVFGPNIYVLDRGSRSLMKFPGANSTFTGGDNWLKSAPGLDFSSITSLAIDGKVWIATSKGEIFSFAQGTKASFQVKGLSKPFASTLKIYTTNDLDSLYVLEAQAGRLVVLSKTGEYKNSYISKDLAAVTSIVVDPTGKTAYLSAGSVVYSLDLQ